jgi:hypothetical protein
VTEFKVGDRVIGLAAFPEYDSELVEGEYIRTDSIGVLVYTDVKQFIRRTIIAKTANRVDDEKNRYQLPAGMAPNGHTYTGNSNSVPIPGGGVRDSDVGKPRFDLIRPKNVPFEDQILTRFAALMALGAEKYAERNWEQFKTPQALDRAMGSFWRHAEKWSAGQTDEDHAASIMANVMFVEYIKGVIDGRWEALSE